MLLERCLHGTLRSRLRPTSNPHQEKLNDTEMTSLDYTEVHIEHDQLRTAVTEGKMHITIVV